MSQSWKEQAAHVGAHLAQEAVRSDAGKQVAAAVVGTGLAVGKTALAAVAAAPVLPIVAVAAATAGLIKVFDELDG